MKKWIAIFILLLIVLATGVYVFIPNKLTVSTTALIRAHPNAVFRSLSNNNKWQQWWPGKASTNFSTTDGHTGFYYQDFHYQLSGPTVDAVPVRIQHRHFITNSVLQVLPAGTDSALVEWKATITTPNNPVKKITVYLQEQEVKNNMKDILKSLSAFLLKKENIYGLDIKEEKVKDTALVTTKASTENYPTPTFIYNLLAQLEKYIALQHARATNYPMLHVDSINKNLFEVQVAIPVNKILPGNNTVAFKRMVPGNILVAEVKGGNKTTEQAFAEMENYMSDHQRSSPAIPFVSLVTNRLQEPDTTKWVSKLYYPVY